MAKRNLPKENQFKNNIIEDYYLEKEIGRGKIGVVYRAYHKDIKEIKAAVKLIPSENLKEGWDIELKKVGLLQGISQVVQYKDHIPKLLDNVLYVCIFWEYIEDDNLRKYAEKYPDNITLPFIEHLIEQILNVFVAMNTKNIIHGDLHEGNILIGPDERLPNPSRPRILISDFGIGGSHNDLKPKDDYAQMALICYNLLRKYIDQSKLGGKDKYFYDKLVEDFLPKKVLETNKTVGSFVYDPRKLLDEFNVVRNSYQIKIKQPEATLQLKNPFDYLSCEEMGDSFEILQKLYSKHFPGYEVLSQKTNTILTGPRGCGKTTIFRNLSLKTQLLGGQKNSLENLDDYIGIYYHCRDLYFAFPYLKDSISDVERRCIIHFFNLAIFYEIFDTLITIQDHFKQLSTFNFDELQKYLYKCIPSYQAPPMGITDLNHMIAFVTRKKEEIKSFMDGNKSGHLDVTFLPLDFIKNVCHILQDSIPWIKGKTFYFFLDDYSLPRISKPLQETLHDFILIRYSELFFKISTESITTFHPYDSKGKLIEETREYDVIDLGSYFLHSTKESKGNFLAAVINNRLQNAQFINTQYQDIIAMLGTSGRSYNALAREIRKPGAKKHLYYHGWDMIVALCSGDVVNVLRLIRDIISLAGGVDKLTTPDIIKIPLDQNSKFNDKDGRQLQDQAIREIGNDFLNRVAAAPAVGKDLRKIAEAFGNIANWYLRNKNSKNQKQITPWQAFRLEVRDTPYFEESLLEKAKKEYRIDARITTNELGDLYEGLIRYGLFLRDVRGKSQRGAVIPRLYIRRLLIPTFLLTPSGRDSIGVEVGEFFMLLSNPGQFVNHMIKKSKAKKKKDDFQESLFDE